MAESEVGLLEALSSLFTRAEATLGPFTVEDDPAWPSPCLQGEAGPGRRYWQPVRQQPRPEAPLAGLGAALQHPIPASLEAFYGSFFSDPITLPSPWGPLSLTLPWSVEEWARLLENQLGHCLQQQRFKLEPAPFIAALEGDEDGIISLRLRDGAVVLEWPGQRTRETLAPSLDAFLRHLLAAL
jgi:SecY interacting protein Syd